MLSLLWALAPGFALIDLTTAIPPGDPTFRSRWFLEGSWGLLTTNLIVIPLLVVFFRPACAPDVILQLSVVAGCCIAAAALCFAPSYIGLAVVVAMTAAVVWMVVGRQRVSAQPRRAWKAWPQLAFLGAYVLLPLLLFGPSAFEIKSLSVILGIFGLSSWLAHSQGPSLRFARGHRARWWPLLVVALAGAGPWVGYALRMAAEYRSGVRYTGLVDRIPAQSVLVLAVVALTIVAAFGGIRFRLPIWTAALTGAGFGAFGLLYPDQIGSPTAGWGAGAIIWSTAIVVAAECLARRQGPGRP